LVRKGGLELEAFCGRERSASPQPKSRVSAASRGIRTLVRKGGLEPPRFYPPGPKSYSGTKSTTYTEMAEKLRSATERVSFFLKRILVFPIHPGTRAQTYPLSVSPCTCPFTSNEEIPCGKPHARQHHACQRQLYQCRPEPRMKARCEHLIQTPPCGAIRVLPMTSNSAPDDNRAYAASNAYTTLWSLARC